VGFLNKMVDKDYKQAEITAGKKVTYRAIETTEITCWVARPASTSQVSWINLIAQNNDNTHRM
jgi:hypothetical protein